MRKKWLDTIGRTLITAIHARIGTATDLGNVATTFGRLKKIKEASHIHSLIVVNDTSSLDADQDTALKTWLEGIGYEVEVADHDDIAGNLELHYDMVVVSGSCLVADAADLQPLRYAAVPVLILNAELAASVVFNFGATPGTVATQTQIEITENTTQWLLEAALGDLTVTASATILTLDTKATNAVEIAQQQGAGTKITIIFLRQGQDDDGATPYAPLFDRYFVGISDFTLINTALKTLLEDMLEHFTHEVRYSEEGVTNVKRAYQERIPDTDFDLSVIDDTLTNPPPSADAENSIVDLDRRQNLTYVLRSFWVKTTDFGTTSGTKLTFALWVLINGSVTKVDEVDVASLGIQNLMDLFGLPEVHADGIWITVVTDATDEPGDAACEGSYRYAEARK